MVIMIVDEMTERKREEEMIRVMRELGFDPMSMNTSPAIYAAIIFEFIGFRKSVMGPTI